jgi:hypothetical protein
MIMDAGKAENLRTTVLQWQARHEMDTATHTWRKKKFAADLTSFLYTPLPRTKPSTNATRGQRTRMSEHDVYIIEVGYTGDLQHADKLAQKTTQPLGSKRNARVRVGRCTTRKRKSSPWEALGP